MRNTSHTATSATAPAPLGAKDTLTQPEPSMYGTVAQTNTPKTIQTYAALLAIFEVLALSLPSSAHRGCEFLPHLRKRNPRLAARLASCGEPYLVSVDGEITCRPEYCGLAVCGRCAPVRGRCKAKHLAAQIIRLRSAWPCAYRLTLTQPCIAAEDPAAAVKRLRTALNKLRSRLRAKGVAQSLGYGGALVSIEVTLSSVRGSHAHAHMIWVGHELDEPGLRSLWAECLSHASPSTPQNLPPETLDVRRLELPETVNDAAAQELTGRISYQLQTPFSATNENSDADLDLLANAVAAAAGSRRHFVARWGVLQGSTGTKRPKKSGKASATEVPAAPVEPAETMPPQQLPACADVLRRPVVVSIRLVDLLATVREAMRTGENTERVHSAFRLLRDFLPVYRSHVESIRSSHAKNVAGNQKPAL